MSETSDFSTRHNLHGLLGGLAVYYFLNKQKNDNALLYGGLTGGFLYWYMSQFQHKFPPDLSGVLADFNKGFAELFGG